MNRDEHPAAVPGARFVSMESPGGKVEGVIFSLCIMRIAKTARIVWLAAFLYCCKKT